MIPRRAIITAIPVLLLLASVAYAQLMGLDGILNGVGGAGGPSARCRGAIDLTKGCALPMLGGIP